MRWGLFNATAFFLFSALLFASTPFLGHASQLDTTVSSNERSILQAKTEGGGSTTESLAQILDAISGLKDGSKLLLNSSRVEVNKPILLDKAITLQGGNGGSPTVLECTGETSAVIIRAGGVTLQNLIIQNCASPAVLLHHPDVDDLLGRPPDNITKLNATLENTQFLDNGDNSIRARGGAVQVTSGWNVDVRNCTFKGNRAEAGGGIYATGSSLNMTGCVFEGNEVAGRGAGVCVDDRDSEDPVQYLQIASCRFVKNKNTRGGVVAFETARSDGSPLEETRFLKLMEPSPSGGGVFALSLRTVRIVESYFEWNAGTIAGGALFLSEIEETEITASEFLRNYAQVGVLSEGEESMGGSVYVLHSGAGSAVITDSKFNSNKASFGGALHFVGMSTYTVGIANCKFKGNKAEQGGGAGVFRGVSLMEWKANNVTRNVARKGGGLMLVNGAGAFFSVGVDAAIEGVFKDNYAMDGGAMYLFGTGVVKIQPQLFTNNKALRAGGAIAAIDGLVSSAVDIEGCLFEGNVAALGGAMYADGVPDVTVSSSLGGSRTIFTNNTALSGGAVHFKGESRNGNEVTIRFADFEGNTAMETINVFGDLIRPVLSFMGVALERGVFLQSGNIEEEFQRPDGIGCGGGACLVLTGESPMPLIHVQIRNSTFTENAAKTGGALMVLTDGGRTGYECKDAPETSPMFNSCRLVSIQAVQFNNNSASAAGGAIFASDPRKIFISKDSAAAQMRLDELPIGTSKEFGFDGNSAAESGFGEVVASDAFELQLVEVHEDGLVIQNHTSGEMLPTMELKVLDRYGQLVKGGTSSAALVVSVQATTLSGDAVARAKDGIIRFDNLRATEMPGVYTMAFSAPEVPSIPALEGKFSIRGCFVGEERDGVFCKKCKNGFFTFDPRTPCRPCVDSAQCPGGPALVPDDGFWHSTPYSTQIHACLLENACTYEKDGIPRNETLLMFYDNPEFLTPGDLVFTNEDHEQCAEGYEGVLCGSCKEGFGRQQRECKKCSGSKAKSRFYIFLVTAWSLVLLGVTIRSAMVSISEMSQLAEFLEQTVGANASPGTTSRGEQSTPAEVEPQSAVQTSSSPPPSLAHTRTGQLGALLGDRELSDALYNVLFVGEHHNNGMKGPSGLIRSLSSIKEETVVDITADTPATERALDNQPSFPTEAPLGVATRLESIRHIVAAENLAETLKIWVNFLQVTSLVIGIHANWTESVLSMLSVQDLLAGFSSAEAVVSTECALPSNSSLDTSVGGSLIRIFFPAILYACVTLLFYLVWVIQRRRTAKPVSAFFTNALVAFLAVMFFAYMQLSEEFMRSVNCVGVDEDTGDLYSKFSPARHIYWAENTALHCFEHDHAVIAIVGIIGLLLITFGIPVFLLLFLLNLRRKGELFVQRNIVRYGFVYQAYNTRTVYWEVVVLARKLLIVSVVVFAYRIGSNLQCLLAMGVLIVAFTMHLLLKPYRYSNLNNLESLSLFVSMATVYAGQVFEDGNTSQVGRIGVSVIIVLANVGAFCVFFGRAWLMFDRYSESKLMSYRKSVPSNFVMKYVKFFTYFVVTSLPDKGQAKCEAWIDRLDNGLCRIFNKRKDRREEREGVAHDPIARRLASEQ